jgi:hypothetical protein
MVNDCGKSSWTPSSPPETDPARYLAQELFQAKTNLTECISFNGGATLRPTKADPSVSMLEFHGDSEAAGLLLEHCVDGVIDPAQSLALQFREGQPKPTLILVGSLGPVFTGKGISVQGVTCGFTLYGMEERVDNDETKQCKQAVPWCGLQSLLSGTQTGNSTCQRFPCSVSYHECMPCLPQYLSG